MRVWTVDKVIEEDLINHKSWLTIQNSRAKVVTYISLYLNSFTNFNLIDQTLRSLSRSLIAPLKQISHEIEEGARSNELSTSQDNQDYSDDMACLELLSTAESDTLTPSVEFCTSFKLKSKSSHSIGSHSKSKSTLGDSNLTLTNLSLSRKEMNQVETTMEDVNHEGDDEEEDNDDDNDHEQESEDYESDDSYAARFVSCLKSITAYASLTQSVAYRDDVSLCGGLFRVITARNRQNADQQNFAFLAKIKEFANSSNSEPAEQMRKHRLEYNEIWIWWRYVYLFVYVYSAFGISAVSIS